MRRITIALAALLGVAGITDTAGALTIQYQLGPGSDGQAYTKWVVPVAGDFLGTLTGELSLEFEGGGPSISIPAGSSYHTFLDVYLSASGPHVVADLTTTIEEALDIGTLSGSIADGTISWNGSITTVTNGNVFCEDANCEWLGFVQGDDPVVDKIGAYTLAEFTLYTGADGFPHFQSGEFFVGPGWGLLIDRYGKWHGTVPEPGTGSLLLLGLCGLAAGARRR
jgi:hypothetical protein